ncbi:hypothetical protein QFZ20_004401 [Flavobacterium sp. W4I14]|nr:hypothetical protein [Flavobacterium sp. W4I14]
MIDRFLANYRLRGIVIPNLIGNHAVLMNAFDEKKAYE